MAKNKLYEGMFLVDSAQAGADWEGVIAAIRTILEKTEAEIDSIRKWDDRKLAYEIKGKSRGVYILSYFRVDGERIQDIEKSVRLSEKIMRVLILDAERLQAEDIEKDTPATKVEKEKEKRKAAKEAAQETEAEHVSAQEETGEAEKAEEVEQTEESKEPLEEKTWVLQESEVSEVPEERAAAEGSEEKQPGQEQVESSEES